MCFKEGTKVRTLAKGRIKIGTIGLIAESNSMSSIVKFESGDVLAMHNSEIELVEEDIK